MGFRVAPRSAFTYVKCAIIEKFLKENVRKFKILDVRFHEHVKGKNLFILRSFQPCYIFQSRINHDVGLPKQNINTQRHVKFKNT